MLQCCSIFMPRPSCDEKNYTPSENQCTVINMNNYRKCLSNLPNHKLQWATYTLDFVYIYNPPSKKAKEQLPWESHSSLITLKKMERAIPSVLLLFCYTCVVPACKQCGPWGHPGFNIIHHWSHSELPYPSAPAFRIWCIICVNFWQCRRYDVQTANDS